MTRPGSWFGLHLMCWVRVHIFLTQITEHTTSIKPFENIWLFMQNNYKTLSLNLAIHTWILDIDGICNAKCKRMYLVYLLHRYLRVHVHVFAKLILHNASEILILMKFVKLIKCKEYCIFTLYHSIVRIFSKPRPFSLATPKPALNSLSPTNTQV